MPGTRRRFLAFALAISFASFPALGDDKDLLKGNSIGAPPNLLIVFGNSQTLTQTISFTGTNFSTFDGDGDSPGSKMGAGKRVIKEFIEEKYTSYNIGMTGFSRDPNAGSTDIHRKHWVYVAVGTTARGIGTVDYPGDSFAEAVGTMERWGTTGSTSTEGPCTTKTVPDCSDRSPRITLASNATVVGPFFGTLGNGDAYIYLNGNSSSANRRIHYNLTTGEYGDGYTDGTLTTYKLGGSPGTHSVVVTKEYQAKVSGTWGTVDTPAGNPGSVQVWYRGLGAPVPPSAGAADASLFFPTGAVDISGDSIAGQAIGFLNDVQNDFDVNANCSGWEFQANDAQVPLVKIPKDYASPDPNNPNVCLPAQNSKPCLDRLLRPQAYLESYDQATGTFETVDPDNPGYTGAGSKDADGCVPELRGAVNQGLDVVTKNTLLTTRNGSQAPIKNILENILAYFKDPKHDGFINGVRGDDPAVACRNSAVIFIYDNFNGCQNDNCGFLTSKVLTPLKQLGIPVYVIGFGANAAATASTGVCIAQNSGAVLPDGTVGYFPVTTAAELKQALNDIADFVLESQKGFVAASVAGAQSAGEQMIYLATFNAASARSIWDGRVNGYKLDANGKLQLGTLTRQDPNDPFYKVPLPAPSSDPGSLIWNAGQNLAQTPGTGATTPATVLAPNAAKTNGTYSDRSNDAVTTIVTTRYPGRKIVFSLPASYADPVTVLPIPPGASPEVRYDMTASTSATWWPALKALLGPQTSPPAVLSPALLDTDATDSLRFIWGDRDAVMGAAANNAIKKYTPPLSTFGLKLGDVFHSTPALIGAPNEVAYFSSNLNGYQAFRDTYRRRRRVLFFGANDGLFHAVDAGAWNRTLSLCVNPDGTPGNCYDLGTGAELFAYAPRATMQIFKPLKDAVGAQTKRDEWTVDGAPTAADVFIDPVNSGAGTPAERAWHTVIVSGVREGSPFEGMDPATPPGSDSLGSYFALDVTQPDELVSDGAGGLTVPIPATFNAPKCLNASGDLSCAREWPQVLWEISDVGDLDASGAPGFGFGDMGETWSKPAVGRVRVCTANCGNTTTPLPVTEDRYVAIVGGGFDRERLDRRGNWLYMIDIETGHVLYRANSSCGINTGAGCSPTYFASIPSEPAALDSSGDGYLDLIYFGDQKGQLWRIDLSDLQMGSAASRWHSQIDPSLGSATPFLVFQAPQPVAPAVDPFYPVYYRPTAVYLGYNVGGRPALGLAFGSGDRDDILSKTYIGSLDFKQRFYYVVDKANTSTRSESDLLDIASPTAPSVTDAPANGWFLEMAKGERVISDSISINGVIFFTTYNPSAPITGTNPCGNSRLCPLSPGTARLYRILYSTGNPYIGGDRGETQTQGGFLSEPVYFQSKDQQGNIFYTTENTVTTENAPGGKKTSVKGWKERSRRP